MTQFFICLVSLPPEELGKAGLRSTTACLGLDSGEETAATHGGGGPPQDPHLIMPLNAHPLKASYRSRKALPPLGLVTAKSLPVSKLPLSFSPCPPERSLIGLSSKFGVWGDAGVRWLRVRAGGGARWAQNITHMFPVHPPRALPTHSLTGEGSAELNPLAAFRK